MLIRHLEFFVTLAEERHFGRAADLCGVSQPALSLAIRKLEEEFGCLLVLRGARFAGLTPEGEKALVWGREILAGFGNLRDDLRGRRKGGLTGVLRLGVCASAMPLLPLFSERFEARNPLARLRVALMTPERIAAGLADLSLDGGLGWLPGASGGLEFLPLWSGELRFACRSDHPFAADGPLTLQDAATQPLCLAEDLAGPDLAGAGLAGAGLAGAGLAGAGLAGAGLAGGGPGLAGLRPSLLCAGLDGVLAHLRGGRWCSLVPQGFAALLAPGDDLRLIPLEGQPPAPRLGALFHPRDPEPPMLRAFRDCAAALAAEAQG